MANFFPRRKTLRTTGGVAGGGSKNLQSPKTGAKVNLSRLKRIHDQTSAAGKGNRTNGVAFMLNAPAIAGMLDVPSISSAFFTSREYDQALDKIGRKWLKLSRAKLRSTKANSGSLFGNNHLSKNMFYGIRTGPRADYAGTGLDQVYISVRAGTRAARYFKQREYGGAIRSRGQMLAIPFLGTKYSDRVIRYRWGETQLGVQAIFSRLGFWRSFTVKSNREKWIMFGEKHGDEKPTPIFVLKAMVMQRAYPNGRFVGPSRDKLEASAYPRIQIKKAWTRFMKNQYLGRG